MKTNKLEQKGLQNDRRWMLIDENNRFLTIREHPRFLFFSLEITDNGFRINYENDAINIPFQLTGETHKADVWDDEVEVIDGKADWNGWFSDVLNINCKLVYLPENSPRPSAKKWSPNEGNVSLADGYPLLVVGTESLHDLNQKLDKSISMDRFRPNLVFDGGEAYEEYRWRDFSIGNVNFHGLKPCKRCVITTYDEMTAEKGKEPLKTLNKQRIDGHVVFGQHAIPLDYQAISVGDKIKVTDYKDSPFDLR